MNTNSQHMKNPVGKSLMQTVVATDILRNAAKVAFIVGLVLNVINQGPALWYGGDISWWHVLLNFLVPFCVSSYSAAKHQMAHAGASKR